MRYPTMTGAPTAYIEGNFRGHKAPPATYSFKLMVDGKELTTSAKILPNPKLDIPASQFAEHDKMMSEMETKLSAMHQTVNQLYKAQKQIKSLTETIPDSTLQKEAENLVKKLVEWDEKMIQRKSQAYDDVENFKNKFTAEYLFLINATDSSILRANQSSIDHKKDLDSQWETLKKEAESLTEAVKNLNKKMWEAGIGAIQLD